MEICNISIRGKGFILFILIYLFIECNLNTF